MDRRTAQEWLDRARSAGLVTEKGLLQAAADPQRAAGLLHAASVKGEQGSLFALLRVPPGRSDGPPVARGKALGVFGPAVEAFEGESFELGQASARIGPLSHANAEALRRALPFTAPSPLAERAVTFGLGDRLGLAGPGHIRTVRRFRASPVLAQQSVRELELTGRSYEEVLDASTWAVFQEGFEEPWGADGDHLKSEEWVTRALSIGFTMITADVSDYIRGEYGGQAGAGAEDARLQQAYAALPEAYRRRIEAAYLPWSLQLDTGATIRFSRRDLQRIALVYREAVEHAARLYRAGVAARGEGGFDFELSVDETATPTTPEAHAFVAMEAREQGVRISSLAPRFVGEFQKGIDYIGDPAELERTFAVHAALARALGYRISVHSGSDKFTAFPIVGRLTQGRFHVKTAGTNWLEAVRVIARREPAVYRRLHAAALERFAAARKYYHVSTNLANVPPLEDLADGELPGLLENRDARQLIHITYGELLRDPGIGGEFFAALQRHMDEYWAGLEAHIGRHFQTLGVAER